MGRRIDSLVEKLRSQTISERLRTSLSIKDTKPATKTVWVWQAVHGNTPFAIMKFTLAVLLMEVFTNDEVPKACRFMNLFVAAVLLVTTESIIFWTYRRGRAEQLVFEMVAVSETVEATSTKEQLSDMRFIAGVSKILCNVYYTNMFCAVLVYATYPFIMWSNLGALPMLGDSEIAFWVLYFLITLLMFVVGPLATTSFLALHLQTCLCLMALYKALGKQIETCPTTEHFQKLLPVHQELLRITYSVRALFYRSCFFQIGDYTSILIANTCVLTEEQNVGVVFVIAMNTSFIYFVCAFSEAMTVSCGKIGQFAYFSDWTPADKIFKTNVLILITKSAKLVFLKAGWIGPLQLHKFTRAMKLWYRIVQMLLNLA